MNNYIINVGDVVRLTHTLSRTFFPNAPVIPIGQIIKITKIEEQEPFGDEDRFVFVYGETEFFGEIVLEAGIKGRVKFNEPITLSCCSSV